MKKWICCCFLLFFLACASGCIPTRDRHVVVAPQSESGEALRISEAAVDEKILALTKILQQKGLTDKENEIASGLLKVYRSLKDASSRRLTKT
ncbi:MAG: hypothetical protein K8R46_13450, partial [Pirellulales bacterium]|nr:hypothetical protein [Pirellulales bacterium]